MPVLQDPKQTVKTALVILVLLSLLLATWLWTPDLSRAELEARYAQSAADFREIAGVRLHVRDSGPRDAPAIVMMHGFGASLHTFEAWANALAQSRVVRFDLPGSGLTGPDPTGDYSDARSLAVLEALLDDLGIVRATLVGHSIGGRIAWKFAATHPERVDRLILVAPDGFASPGFEYGKAPKVPALVGIMTRILPQALLRMNLAPGYADPGSLTDGLVTRYHDLIRAPGVRRALLERMRQTVLEDPLPYLRRIEAPTLLLWGEQDAMIPVRNAADYQRALPRATLVTLPGVGHVPQEEGTGAALEHLRRFLPKRSRRDDRSVEDLWP